MSETETDQEFVARIEKTRLFRGDDDRNRLVRLARRGAAIPDEPDEMVIDAMQKAFRETRRGGVSGMTIDAQYRAECAPELAAYRAMLTAALKDTDTKEAT